MQGLVLLCVYTRACVCFVCLCAYLPTKTYNVLFSVDLTPTNQNRKENVCFSTNSHHNPGFAVIAVSSDWQGIKNLSSSELFFMKVVESKDIYSSTVHYCYLCSFS